MSSAPDSDASLRARRSLFSTIFLIVMVVASIVAIVATIMLLTGTYITGALPTAVP